MATLYKSNGDIIELSPKHKRFSLKELQDAVGGYIEYIRFGNDKIIVVNEEGLLLNLPVNENVNKITARHGFIPLVGDIVIADRNQIILL